MEEQKSNSRIPDIPKYLRKAAEVFYGILQELYYGIRFGYVHWQLCWIVGAIAMVWYILEWDKRIFEFFLVGKLYPRRTLSSLIYWATLSTSGFWLWGFYRWALRLRKNRDMEPRFSEAGLKSSLGRVPQFIFDKALDEQTRLLRVTTAGSSLAGFKKAKDALQTNLKVFIDDFKENRREGTIDVIYSSKEMPMIVGFREPKSLPPRQFLIGETRAHVVTADLKAVPHILVAGQTGGGKSTFLRQFIVTHYLNLPDSKFVLIDLKEGVEFQIFKDLPNVQIFETVNKAVLRLKDFNRLIQARLTTLKNANCMDIDQYFEKCSEKSDLKRNFIVVDEAAELFLGGGGTSSKDAQEARRCLSDIARRGRAAGIHLVLATQRPDSRSLDPQVKANLPGVLCFQMANDASSILVLGVGRATDLPGTKGRAIWKVGGEMVEIQTPLMTDVEALALLESKKIGESQTDTGANRK